MVFIKTWLVIITADFYNCLLGETTVEIVYTMIAKSNQYWGNKLS